MQLTYRDRYESLLHALKELAPELKKVLDLTPENEALINCIRLIDHEVAKGNVMAPEDKIRKKKPWWKRLWLNLKAHITTVTGYDKDFKENMKLGVKAKWRF